MEFRLLGPVEVHADTGQLPIRGPIQRALVAMLALHANRVVASQVLLRSAWDPASRRGRRTSRAAPRSLDCWCRSRGG